MLQHCLCQEFCEECPDQTRVVQRSPALANDAQLPGAFQAAAGDLLYAGLRDGLTVGGEVRLASKPPQEVSHIILENPSEPICIAFRPMCHQKADCWQIAGSIITLWFGSRLTQ